jgi:predicted ABC-type ATPase
VNTQNPKVIIIAGPNGAGKSTLAPHLLKDAFGLLEYVNADTIALGLSAFSPESVAFEAGRIMLKRLRNLAQTGESFAFESTLASRSYVRWIGELKKRRYSFHLIYLWLRSPELAVERVRERVRMGGHDVPEPVIRRRYLKGGRNLFVLYQSLADSWAIYDNSVSAKPVLIAIGKSNNDITILDNSLWRIIREAAQ